MIFISHNHKDKGDIEPVATELASIFGEEKVFYDEWSIRPGDNIIGEMNRGLKEAEFVFFFISANSLQSEMVSLEWMNALMKSTTEFCKLVPVILERVDIPPIISRIRYIDMYANGLENSLREMIVLVNGSTQHQSIFQPEPNITWSFSGDICREITVTIVARTFSEPNCVFLICLENDETDFRFELARGEISMNGFNENIFNDGKINALVIQPLGRPLTPEQPIQVILSPVKGKEIKLMTVYRKARFDPLTGNTTLEPVSHQTL